MDSIALLLDEDIVHFMAWLDFCCEKKMDFLTTIIDYLHDSREKQRKIPYSITVEEVVGGLIILAKRSKKPPSPGVCLSNGSSHFTCLSEKCKANIKSEVDKLLSLSLRQSKSQDKRLGKSLPPRSPQTTETNDSVRKPDVSLGNCKTFRDALEPKDVSYTSISLTATTTESLVTQLTSKNLTIKNIQEEWKEEVEKFQEDLEKQKKIEIDLRADLLCFEQARAVRRAAGNDSIQDYISDMRKTTYLLTKEINELRQNLDFMQSIPMDFEVKVETEIQNMMQELGLELEDILLGHDTTQRLQLPDNFSASGELGNLMPLLDNISDKSKKALGLLKKLLLSFDKEVIVRSICVAALQQWVFATDFPNFLPRQRKLLNSYRQVVLTNSGWKGLHNLERLAYKSLLEHRDFQEYTIPRNANKLAIRLSETLAPLFPGYKDNVIPGIFKSWGENQDVCNSRLSRFMRIFKAALRIKSMATMSSMKYEFITSPPGTKYVPKNPKPSTSKHEVHVNRVRNAEGSDAILLATIYACEGRHQKDPIDSATINTDNFVTISPVERCNSIFYTCNLIVASSQPVLAANCLPLSSETPKKKGWRKRGNAKESTHHDSRTNTMDSGDEYFPGEHKTNQKRTDLTAETSNHFQAPRKWGIEKAPTQLDRPVNDAQLSICTSGEGKADGSRSHREVLADCNEPDLRQTQQRSINTHQNTTSRPEDATHDRLINEARELGTSRRSMINPRMPDIDPYYGKPIRVRDYEGRRPRPSTSGFETEKLNDDRTNHYQKNANRQRNQNKRDFGNITT